MQPDFTEEEIARYARHILLEEVGGTGQARLRAASVLIAGAGGLGSPLALYLAAAGIGTIGIADDDTVELSNLQRQIAHTTARIGHTKTSSAATAASALNPLVRIVSHNLRITAANAPALLAPYDIVCDGTDNFDARYALADAAWRGGKTLISAAILRFEGQLATFRPGHAGAGTRNPCYRCLYAAPPPAGLVPSCAQAGVLGPVTGVMGTLQATEVLKEVLQIGQSLVGRVLTWDALAARFRLIALPADPDCPFCGPHPRPTGAARSESEPAGLDAGPSKRPTAAH